MQQNQIKKARKIQDDIRGEQERLVNGHLARLRRAAAAELQADNKAKQITMGWLQGSLSEEDLEPLDHWRTLLAAVLDLQQQQQAEPAAADGPRSKGQQQAGAQQQPQQQQQAAAGAEGLEAAGGMSKLLAWLQQPDSRQHYLRVVLECLRELGAAEIPARVLLQHKVGGLAGHNTCVAGLCICGQCTCRRVLPRDKPGRVRQPGHTHTYRGFTVSA